MEIFKIFGYDEFKESLVKRFKIKTSKDTTKKFGLTKFLFTKNTIILKKQCLVQNVQFQLFC